MSELRVCSQCGRQNSADRVTCNACQSPLIVSGSVSRAEPGAGTRIQCPYCAEEILAAAKKCKHCGEWLNGESEELFSKVVDGES